MGVSLDSVTFSPPTLPSYVWNGYNQVGKLQNSAGQRGVQTVQNAIETIRLAGQRLTRLNVAVCLFALSRSW
jgi:hypothetical protein